VLDLTMGRDLNAQIINRPIRSTIDAHTMHTGDLGEQLLKCDVVCLVFIGHGCLRVVSGILLVIELTRSPAGYPLGVGGWEGHCPSKISSFWRFTATYVAVKRQKGGFRGRRSLPRTPTT